MISQTSKPEDVKDGNYLVVWRDFMIRVNGIVHCSGWLQWSAGNGYKGLARPNQWKRVQSAPKAKAKRQG